MAWPAKDTDSRTFQNNISFVNDPLIALNSLLCLLNFDYKNSEGTSSDAIFTQSYILALICVLYFVKVNF